MEAKPYAEIIEREFAFLLNAGFSYEYTYDKGSDSSCVYIYRFRKGRDFLDLRQVSGGGEGTLVVYADGGYLFPNLRSKHKKLFRVFFRKHLFSKATTEEKWRFAAELLKAEISDGRLFGIAL